MKNFKEFMASSSAYHLHEGRARTAAVVALAAKAKRDGDLAKASYVRAKQTLAQRRKDDDLNARLQRLEDAIEALADGLLYQREQIGSLAGISVAGHALTARNLKKRR